MKLMRAMALVCMVSEQPGNEIESVSRFLSPLKAHPYPPLLVRSFSAMAV